MTTAMTRPNIVFILTDQQRYDTIAATGHPWMDTPNLDRMVSEGTTFENMYVPSPVCSASRASLFSGTYPHNSGVLRNDEPWVYSWVGALARSGYHCVNIGKMHTFPAEEMLGFHERHVTENKDRTHPVVPFYLDNWDKAFWARGIKKPGADTYSQRKDYGESLGAFEWEPPEELHSDVFVPQFACHWLDTWDGDAPFFLQIGIPGPHPPYDPPKRLFDRYLAKDNLPLPIRDDVAELITPLRRLRERHMDWNFDSVVHLDKPSPAQMHRQRAAYYANCALIDEQVGEIFAALERRGVLDNTIVIFSSDHGDCINDHGLSQKWNMYEQSVKVPAVIWGPEQVKSGHRVAGLVSLMDWAPTILEIAQAEIPGFFEAIPLTGHLDGSQGEVREQVFSELAGDAVVDASAFQIMVRDRSWKLVHYVDYDEGLLFDLEGDPEEIRNLWNDPDHETIRSRLLLEILNWRIRSGLATQSFSAEIQTP